MVSPSRGCVTRAARECAEEGETAGCGVTGVGGGYTGDRVDRHEVWYGHDSPESD